MPTRGSSANPPLRAKSPTRTLSAFTTSVRSIEGVDLAAMIRRDQLPLELALSIARQVCEVLGDAHQVGVAHRDLKPANIMIDRVGQAYLMEELRGTRRRSSRGSADHRRST
jgi:serine/threonine protein kinase